MLSARVLSAALGAAATLFGATASAQDPSPAPPEPLSPASIGLPPLPTTNASTIPVPAWPRAPHQDDVVVMNDGGMARGAVIEILPKVQVSVRLSDGRTMIIPWDRVHHIEQGASIAQPAAPVPAPAASPRAAPAASPRTTGTAIVHLDGIGATGARLERERAGQWIAACTAPCDKPLELDAFYRIGGDGIRNSKPFRLLAKDGDRVTVTADVSSTTMFGLGITLATLGAVVGTISYYGLLIASSQGTSYSRRDNDGVVGGFAIALLGSAGLGTAGLVATIVNEKSGVKQTVGVPATATSSAPKTRASDPDRMPAWTSMGSAVPDQRGAPMAMTVPLLGGRF